MPTLPSAKVGKRVHGALYLHRAALTGSDEQLQHRVAEAAQLAGAAAEGWNVIKLDGKRITLLIYESLASVPFPALLESVSIDLATRQVGRRSYRNSSNPPILHRKELLLPADYPDIELFRQLTRDLETAGLFKDSHRIGFRQQWEAKLTAAGYRILNHRLLGGPALEETQEAEAQSVQRHRTAIARSSLSAPLQALERHGYLDGSRSVFDYGCGRGDDLRVLKANGIPAHGWDPYYAPDKPKLSADIVNLGFVINVIEDAEERAATLRAAFTLARQCLVIAAMLTNRNAVQTAQAFGDGVLTRWHTFQKYYSQSELRAFIEDSLDRRAIALGPGVFLVFADEQEEQRFLSERQRNRLGLSRIIARLPRPTREEKQAERYERHRPLLETLWATLLDLGREPHETEVTDAAALAEAFGSLHKAVGFLNNVNGLGSLQAAARARQDDLLVYLALQVFDGRTPYRQLEERLQRDIRAFFGNYEHALAQATRALYQIADAEAIIAACAEAAGDGIGYWDPAESHLQLQTGLVEALPPLLRIYVGCAAQLYGDLAGADLIKIHGRSGKLSLMLFDDFTAKPLPRMIERIKIDLRRQTLDFFHYSDPHPAPFLFWKSRYIDESFPHYREQRAFDEALAALGLFDLEGYGPAPAVFEETLHRYQWAIEDFTLRRVAHAPRLDDPCGKYLTYRDLIECGETQAATGIENLPQQPDTYTALSDLVREVLDPVMDYFGGIELTYGFCSLQLARAVKRSGGRIVPKQDQHASHELDGKGMPICTRLGVAVDFRVPDENMAEVAQWIIENTNFDRLYYYGNQCPVHVSVGPEASKQVVLMRETVDGRQTSRLWKIGDSWLDY